MFRMLIIFLIPVSVLLILSSSCLDDNGSRVIDPDPVDTMTARGGDDKMMFYENCASCHSIFKNMTGPSLDRVVQVRDSAWIFTFLTDRKRFRPDSISQSFKKEFSGFECLDFPGLTRDNVGAILRYINVARQPRY